METRDFSSWGLQGYARRLNESFVLRDLKKYRKFPSFLETHKELFSSLPVAASMAVREMLTVDGVPKKARQRAIWKAISAKVPPLRLLRLVWDAWRSVR
jgi:electron transfer flavoprotein-quinone oxidoreductase